MSQLLRDLYFHQAWADAEHWRAIETCPAALEDEKVRERLHHIHYVQRAFLWAVGDQSQPFARSKADDFATPRALKGYGQAYHLDVLRWVQEHDEATLARPVAIPWFKDPPLTLTVLEALTQAAMHSHYHRGQNATRLRQLGGEPPLTDLIVWYWKGRPEADWS